jgi:hypothetical protein
MCRFDLSTLKSLAGNRAASTSISVAVAVSIRPAGAENGPARCEILKQHADRLRERFCRKNGVEGDGFSLESSCPFEVSEIAVSQSGAEFFLDKVGCVSYHDAKFPGRLQRGSIFRLRPPGKFVNWPSCLSARLTLPFGVRDGYAEGRKHLALT